MMLYKIGFLFFGLVLFVSCGSNTSEQKQQVVKTDSVAAVPLTDYDKLLNEAKRLDNILLNATVVNPNIADQAITAFSNFETTCKTDSLAPVFLVKAGQVALSIGKFTQAETFFVKCKDEFPNFKNRGAALFLLAQLYDDASKLNDEPKAKIIYSQIIKEYPESNFAADSKAAIQNLGKTDEQLVQEFLKKNK